jgi:phosphate/sulfate permease
MKLTVEQVLILKKRAFALQTMCIAIIAHVSWIVIAFTCPNVPFTRALVGALAGVALLAGMLGLCYTIMNAEIVREGDRIAWKLKQERKARND